MYLEVRGRRESTGIVIEEVLELFGLEVEDFVDKPGLELGSQLVVKWILGEVVLGGVLDVDLHSAFHGFKDGLRKAFVLALTAYLGKQILRIVHYIFSDTFDGQCLSSVKDFVRDRRKKCDAPKNYEAHVQHHILCVIFGEEGIVTVADRRDS